MAIALLLGVAVVLAVIAYLGRYLGPTVALYRRSYRMDKMTAGLPSLPRLPLLGNALDLKLPVGELYGHLLNLSQHHGNLLRLWLGPMLGLVVSDPDDLQVVFTSPNLTDKPEVLYCPFEPLTGRGLITINGADYKRHRKAITASLHLNILQEFLPTFMANARKLEARLDALAASGEVFDVVPLLGWCASHTVCETVLASEFPGLAEEKDTFVEAVHIGNRLLPARALQPWYGIELVWWLLDRQLYRDFMSASKIVFDFSKMVLVQKLNKFNERAEAVGPQSDAELQARPRRQTFLDQFLASPDASAFSLDELHGELQTLFVTGAGTSMDFQCFFLLCMALEPEIQKKVQMEIDEVFGAEPTRDVEVSDLPHFTYMECVLKETLRFFPPAPNFLRQATRDVTLPSGQVIPEGAVVIILPALPHGDPRHFPDPLRFDPDRFGAQQSRGRHPYAFIPFSAGTRSCIGQRYAMMFAKTVAATVLRRFDVLPDPQGPRRLQDVGLVGGLALSVKGGAHIRLRPRRADCLTPPAALAAKV